MGRAKTIKIVMDGEFHIQCHDALAPLIATLGAKVSCKEEAHSLIAALAEGCGSLIQDTYRIHDQTLLNKMCVAALASMHSEVHEYLVKRN